MKFLNQNNEQLYILHFPGQSDPRTFSHIQKHLETSTIRVDPRISIIILATKGFIENSPVIYQLRKSNVKFYNWIENLDESQYSNAQKLHYISTRLKEIDTPYSIILDARDVVLSANLDETFIDAFESFNCNILYNASNGPHPNYLIIDGIDTVGEKHLDDINYRPFLNAGVVVGRTDKLQQFYTKVDKMFKSNFSLGPYSDQLYIKMSIEDSDKVEIDHYSKMLITIHSNDIQQVLQSEDELKLYPSFRGSYFYNNFDLDNPLMLPTNKKLYVAAYADHNEPVKEFISNYYEDMYSTIFPIKEVLNTRTSNPQIKTSSETYNKILKKIYDANIAGKRSIEVDDFDFGEEYDSIIKKLKSSGFLVEPTENYLMTTISWVGISSDGLTLSNKEISTTLTFTEINSEQYSLFTNGNTEQKIRVISELMYNRYTKIFDKLANTTFSYLKPKRLLFDKESKILKCIFSDNSINFKKVKTTIKDTLIELILERAIGQTSIIDQLVEGVEKVNEIF